MSYVPTVLLFYNFIWAQFTFRFKLNVGTDLKYEYIWIIKERNVCLYLKDVYLLWCCNLEYMNVYVDFWMFENWMVEW